MGWNDKEIQRIKGIKKELEENNLYKFSERPDYRYKYTKYDEILNTIVPDTAHWDHWIKSENKEKKIDLAKKVILQQCLWDWDWDELKRTKEIALKISENAKEINRINDNQIKKLEKKVKKLSKDNMKLSVMVNTYELMESIIKDYGLFDIFKTKVLLKEIKEDK